MKEDSKLAAEGEKTEGPINLGQELCFCMISSPSDTPEA